MTKLTTERLETIATWREKYGNGANVMIPAEEAELMARQLLAYEQAADRPVGEIFRCSGNKTLRWWNDVPEGTVLYAAPVLPKQPEPENKNAQIKRQKALAWLKRVAYENPCMKEVKTCIEVLSAPAQPALVEKLKKVMNSWLAMEPKLAFQPEFTDVMMLLDAEPAPAQPVIPRELRSFVTDADIAALHRFAECCDDPESGGHDLEKEQVQRLEKIGALQRSGRISYITDFGDYLISATAPINAQPVSEPYKLPSGYALVPCKLTAENGAKSCMIGEFTEQTEISCPECFGDDECETCDGSGMIEVTVPVSWTTIKDIWAKGIEHFAVAPAQEQK
ncbi:hypothetical protein [Hafnia alvei]|uniref:hypothetical protein n=1 Tax=Hafnia alvei TaxID=569 RepID=UPI001D0F567B|nr:hypothetical protein [Hafnia alvei]